MEGVRIGIVIQHHTANSFVGGVFEGLDDID